MCRMYIELIEMRRVRLEQLDVREADRVLSVQGNPKKPVSLSGLEIAERRGLGKDRFRCVTGEQSSGSQLDRRKRRKIVNPR
jgi:hypothetical protein